MIARHGPAQTYSLNREPAWQISPGRQAVSPGFRFPVLSSSQFNSQVMREYTLQNSVISCRLAHRFRTSW
jgi:hypothetical protein